MNRALPDTATPTLPRLPYLEGAERDLAIVRQGAIFREETVTAEDGTPLAVFEAGDPSRPTVLVVNALGSSCLLLAPLVRALAAGNHVMTWESRGLPDTTTLGDDADLSVPRHSADAAAILAARGRLAHRVVAFCSGANVALHAIDTGLIAPGRLCIVSPSMELPTAEARTDYQRTMMPMWESVAANGPAHAALVRALINQGRKPEPGTPEAEIHAIDGIPFGSDSATYRYARMQADCLTRDRLAALGRIAVPTLVLHGRGDDMIHEATSAAVAKAVPGAEFRVVDGHGHFAVHGSHELHGLVSAFLDGRDDAPTAGPANR